jgi:MYXO-CTERM domain-containing protein
MFPIFKHLRRCLGALGPLSLVLWGLPAGAQALNTTLTVGQADPYAIRYSQALDLEAVLVDENDQGYVGLEVEFYLQHEGGSEFLIGSAFTDSSGRALRRLAVVDGLYGGQNFPAAAETPETLGERYTIRVVFAGSTITLNPPAAVDGGQADGGAPPDAGPPPTLTLEATSGSGELFVSLEKSFLDLAPGNEANLGDTITLVATLTDENGNAPESGNTTDGVTALGISGRTIGFFHDKNGNGRPENTGGEFLGTAETNSSGVATFDFEADPDDNIKAGDFDLGLHVQFSGDDRYQLTGDSSRLVIHPGQPDANKTLVEIEPKELDADGFSQAVITATLVDTFNNPLTLDSERHPVHFELSAGKLLETLERNPTTGHYTQPLRAPNEPGEGKVTVTIEGFEGQAEATITFRGAPGCACASHDDSPLAGLFLLLGAIGLFLLRKNTRSAHP